MALIINKFLLSTLTTQATRSLAAINASPLVLAPCIDHNRPSLGTTSEQRRNITFWKYKGPFELKNYEKQSRRKVVPTYKELELFEDVRRIRSAVIKDPSPFHLVARYKPIKTRPWWELVTLRHLGLHCHDSEMPDWVLVPNTPRYNQLLCNVKHMIHIKPVKFPDGLPTPQDIGRCHIDVQTGEFRIGDAYKRTQKQIDESQKPDHLKPLQMRRYLKKISGILY